MTPRCQSMFHSAGCRLFQGHDGPHQSWYGEEWGSETADSLNDFDAVVPPMTTPEPSTLLEEELAYRERVRDALTDAVLFNAMPPEIQSTNQSWDLTRPTVVWPLLAGHIRDRILDAIFRASAPKEPTP